MIWLFLGIPLIEITIFSIFRVKSKTHLTGEIVYHSFFQTIIAYLVLLLIFYQSFFFKFYPIIIFGFLLLFLSLLYFLKDNELSFTVSGILKLEGIKNNILIALVTVYPFYVFLTIFRFNNWFIQLLLSLVLVFVVLVLSMVLRKTMENLYQKLKNYIMDSDLGKYIVIWSIFGFLLLFNIFFQLPLNPLKNSLNLSNNAPYFRFDGLPTDVDNSYKQNLIHKLTLTENDGRSIEDYIITDGYLYLVQDNILYKYDIETAKMIKKHYLPGKVNNNYFNDILFVSEDNLYLYCAYGLYKITEDDLIKIGDINSDNTRRVRRSEDEVLFLKNIDQNLYDLYALSDDALNLEENINLDMRGYDELIVISETLFYQDGYDYILFDDESKRFEDIDATFIYYNSTNRVIHYLKDNKIYFNDGTQNIQVIDYIGRMLIEGEVVGDLTIIRDGTKFDDTRLLLFNYDMSRISIYNHLDLDRFSKVNNYNVSYVANYRSDENHIQFLQVEANSSKTNLLIYNLENKNVDLRLPFYSHYSLLSVIVIIVAIIIPITDDIKYLTYLDYNSMVKRD